MNANALNDLQQKIKNLVHDFELEYEIEGQMTVGLTATTITIEAKERASGGPVTPGQLYDISAVTEMYVPVGERVPNASGWSLEEQLRGYRDSVDVPNESGYEAHAMDAADDYTTPTPSPDIGIEQDGQVFNSQAEYENWLAQQNRKSKR